MTPELPPLSNMLRPLAKGTVVAVASFALLGTISALWSNPLFVRMAPAGTAEIVALSLLSVFAGLFAAVRRPRCSVRMAGVGGVAGFLGVACPTCNILLMLIFGGEFLLAYFEPVRLYLAAAGIFILAFATGRELIAHRRDAMQHHGNLRSFGA